MKKTYFATKDDVDRLHSFFGQANKKDDKINELYGQFMIMEDNGEIQAVIGYEQKGENALIRSCLFTPAVDNETFLYFFEMFLQYMKEKNIWQVYLLTNHPQSVTIFQFFNFISVEKDQVSDDIQQLEHFCENIKQQDVIILNCQLFTKLSTD
ncbi:mechanosensitive ion channel protein [Bacillus cereus]|uniref:mechanosensitive ion channel protein n=1 Tax=unclassified Bacillus (in: firmicutes) TaxID=185979 RepID=UPI00047CFE38|nr:MULTISPECIES: mechanosensitive ion channel protein [unclassified Bacillus (in: firmicutes)]PFD95849.1 mechanosensitive ion channel protein [Bacillus sp. AFS023182]PGX94195.1 mechanosensitive ion channel protein [Bacillus cereus]SDZ41495.1 N-acetylglutamate synthase, GNAT family [Bacillus sp. 166amftsu]